MQVHVERSGAGSPLVMLHGMGASSATWSGCRELLEQHHEVISMDLPGHGRSSVDDDPAEYTRDRALGHLDELLASVSGRPILIGHSLGGYLALAFAATRPGVARGIVVLNTGPGYRDPVKREEWNARSRRNAHRFGVPTHVADLNLQEDSVVMDKLAEIETPTLFLAGGLDREEYASSGRYLERKMPTARFVLIPEGEHSMQETHPAAIAAEIEEFVLSLPT